MEINPKGSKVLVRKIELRNQTASGILLGHGKPSENEAQAGVIVAQGPGGWIYSADGSGFRPDMDTEVGDTVLFYPRAGVPVRSGSEYLLLMDISEIVATVAQ